MQASTVVLRRTRPQGRGLRPWRVVWPAVLAGFACIAATAGIPQIQRWRFRRPWGLWLESASLKRAAPAVDGAARVSAAAGRAAAGRARPTEGARPSPQPAAGGVCLASCGVPPDREGDRRRTGTRSLLAGCPGGRPAGRKLPTIRRAVRLNDTDRLLRASKTTTPTDQVSTRVSYQLPTAAAGRDANRSWWCSTCAAETRLAADGRAVGVRRLARGGPPYVQASVFSVKPVYAKRRTWKAVSFRCRAHAEVRSGQVMGWPPRPC